MSTGWIGPPENPVVTFVPGTNTPCTNGSAQTAEVLPGWEIRSCPACAGAFPEMFTGDPVVASSVASMTPVPVTVILPPDTTNWGVETGKLEAPKDGSIRPLALVTMTLPASADVPLLKLIAPTRASFSGPPRFGCVTLIVLYMSAICPHLGGR